MKEDGKHEIVEWNERREKERVSRIKLLKRKNNVNNRLKKATNSHNTFRKSVI